MKNAYVFVLAVGLLAACGKSEKKEENTTSATTDSTVVAAPKPKNCQSILKADKLGKSNEYQESAKPMKFTLTLDQDTSATSTEKGCYFNNTATILAVKKSGSRVFKRTLAKDDIAYFSKNDELIARSVLQNATYKPTFNGQRYVTITVRLIDPVGEKKSDYLVFMNYFGEIVKVK
ncbi:hypothetical protein IC229_13785 [Spirosoma sp. BT702]|uniref:Lipoprotein n=1 Tax=Spirosoma profusum TaxID=2771354 RepID=A0A926XX92_9BACT|nr:hypothetical protein [Spirosoma profusum]MBD2701716.1 hypothetical protein [Spirosoma profusum]